MSISSTPLPSFLCRRVRFWVRWWLGSWGRWWWRNEGRGVGLEHSSAQKLARLVSSAGEGAASIKLSVEKPVQPH